MDKQTEGLPETIWHFTNSVGLAGGLKSHQLWTSHVAYLKYIRAHTGQKTIILGTSV